MFSSPSTEAVRWILPPNSRGGMVTRLSTLPTCTFAHHNSPVLFPSASPPLPARILIFQGQVSSDSGCGLDLRHDYNAISPLELCLPQGTRLQPPPTTSFLPAPSLQPVESLVLLSTPPPALRCRSLASIDRRYLLLPPVGVTLRFTSQCPERESLLSTSNLVKTA